MSPTCSVEPDCPLIVTRGINEGRQAAGDVDIYLMGLGTQLPTTGGIIRRAPYEVLGHHERHRATQAVAVAAS